MAAIGAIAAVGSGVVGAVGAMQQAQAASAAATYNKQVADYNASVSQRNQQATLDVTGEQQEEQRRENRRTLGTIRAAYGASGLTLEGSPLDVMEDTAQEQAYGVAKIGYKGAVKAIGYKDEAANYTAKGVLDQMQADYAERAGPINAAAALLGGVSKAAGAFNGGGATLAAGG